MNIEKFLLKFLLFVSLIGFWVASYTPSAIKSNEIYVVQCDDTLWDIAQKYTAKDSRYINELIYDIIQDNPELKKSKGMVYPGQKLTINIRS